MIRARWVAPVLLAAVLAGCSGDGDGDEQPGQGSGQQDQNQQPAETGGSGGGAAPTATPAPAPSALVAGKQISDVNGRKINVAPVTLKRQGKLALLEISATNTASERVNLAIVLRGSGVQFDDVTLIDPKGGKRYIVARDNEDDCLCTTFGSGGITIQPQETAIVSAYFAAPPADVTTVNVELPAKAGTFTDVPIS